MNERRRKLVPVSSVFIVQQAWNTGTVIHVKCVEGLPADATFIGLTYDHMRDVYYFCYQSAEWDEVPDGMMLPTFSPTFTNLYVAPFLEQAEGIIADEWGEDSPWVTKYRAFKERTGYPDGD